MVYMVEANSPQPIVVAVSISPGGIPKIPCDEAIVGANGIEGDGHEHAAHVEPLRALSLWDEELMHQLIDEGYELAPGTIGENVLVRDLHVQKMAPGTLLQLGEVVARLEEPRQPCFVLDSIDRRLKADAVGRCGYMASIVRGGTLRPGAAIAILE